MVHSHPSPQTLRAGIGLAVLLALSAGTLHAAAPQVPAVRDFRVADRTPILVDLLAYASDADGDPLTCEEPASTAAGVQLVQVADCVVEYHWPADPLVQYDEFTYLVRDAMNVPSAVATVTLSQGIVLSYRPLAPTGVSAAALGSSVIQLSWYDQSNNESFFRVQGRPVGGSFSVLAGNLPPNSQTFTHTTTAGTSWEFFVEACNAVGCSASSTASATTPAGSGNHPPVAHPDPDASSGAQFTLPMGGSIAFPKSWLTANDTDPDALEVLSVVAPTGTTTSAKGELRETAPGRLGWYLYQHNGLAAGSDTFSYTISDGEAQATSTVTFTISGPPTPVVAHPDTFATAEGVPLYIRFDALLDDDDGTGKNVNLLGFSKPTQGKLDFCCHAQFPGPPEGLWFLPDNGNLNAAKFRYTIVGAGGSSSTSEVTINITEDGVSPDPTQTFPFKSIKQVLVDANGDVTPGASAQLVLTFSDLKRGLIPGTPPALVADLGELLQFRLFEIQETGIGDVTAWLTPYVPFTPGVTSPQWSPKDYEGAFVFSRTIPDASSCTGSCNSNAIKYRLRGADLVASPWTSFTIQFEKPTATGINLAALPDFGPTLAVPEGELLTFPVTTLLANDVFDSAANPTPINYALLGRPIWGAFEGNPAQDFPLLRYRAPSNYRGVDHFAYSITPTGCAGSPNEWACSRMARVVIEILPGAPVAAPDAVAVPFETAVRFEPLSNDSDPQGQPLHMVGINIQPQHGTAVLEPSGAIVYTPARNYSGGDTLRYRIEDPWGNQATADVTLTVAQPPNRPPVAVDDSVSIESGISPVSIDIAVLTNDFDPDAGDVLQVIDVTWSTRAINITILPNGMLRYEAPGAIAEVLTYTISDAKGNTAQADVYVNVVPCSACN